MLDEDETRSRCWESAEYNAQRSTWVKQGKLKMQRRAMQGKNQFPRIQE